MEIILERETANDETATIVTILKADGDLVEKDEPLFEIEHSKATQEIMAPEAGQLAHELKRGQTVPFGIAIAHIRPAAAEEVLPATMPDAAVSAAAASACQQTQYVSHVAAALMAQLGLSPAAFGAFVTAADVRAAVGLAPMHTPQPLGAPAPPPAGMRSPAAEGPFLPARKRSEIAVLESGAGNTMLSVLGAHLGPLRLRRASQDFLQDSILDAVVYEASRLMRRYPLLNAYYKCGEIVKHASIHAGIALDSGGRLAVYGVENADRIGLPDLGVIIANAVARYAEEALTPAELSRATFTVTDLSAENLDFLFPLLPLGQSCILGITRDPAFGYRLFAGFDHRVTEGRTVAAFLNELRSRMLSFIPAASAATIAECKFCGRSAIEVIARNKDRGLLKIIGRNGEEVLCCASCWNRW